MQGGKNPFFTQRCCVLHAPPSYFPFFKHTMPIPSFHPPFNRSSSSSSSSKYRQNPAPSMKLRQLKAKPTHHESYQPVAPASFPETVVTILAKLT
ncbi:hypothetical protein BDZ91DRAFT_290404 [Kalaharituber pfeilii]|nr:hypothetical protein BDZ91DRAFT_290404 [Kalaharituber pfeilii]